ncbi:hypothetical protein CTheo_6524 [Ceratobasidium theobromae]|uniref:Uncharacterized protein n=1 Tax=Ceratobasidium theobromae TaxID=1582974 RepID=A0A5N5QEI4_9AGAM|nr:hypothetical protein CTheo_6524 [Ceratobasidium theobromae]
MVHSPFTQPATSRSALHPAGRSFCPELIDKDVAPFNVRKNCWLSPTKPARWMTEVDGLQSSIVSSSTTWAPEHNPTRGISYYTPGLASAYFDYSNAPLYASSLDFGVSSPASEAVGPPATSFLDSASESDILRLIDPPVLPKLLSPLTPSISTKLNQRDNDVTNYATHVIFVLSAWLACMISTGTCACTQTKSPMSVSVVAKDFVGATQGCAIGRRAMLASGPIGEKNLAGPE